VGSQDMTESITNIQSVDSDSVGRFFLTFDGVTTNPRNAASKLGLGNIQWTLMQPKWHRSTRSVWLSTFIFRALVRRRSRNLKLK